MAIKAGQILHDANGFIIDRIQTGGVGNLNIPEEKIYELGNYQTVATIRDIPDLSFDLESLDVSTEIETIITDQTGAVDGDEIDFADAKPVDIISPFKSAQGAFNTVRGLVVPNLTLENVTYRFGTRANATKAFTLRGDSIYYVPGTPYYQEFSGTGIATNFSFTNNALAYNEGGSTHYALSVCVQKADGTYKRLFAGTDYTETATGITLTAATLAPAGSTVKVTYGSATSATYNQAVHQGVGVKPAAVRGKDIDVYVDNGSGTLIRWGGVQSFEVTRRVNLDNDEEFGNRHYVSQDYDTADVTGSVTIRPRDVTDLWDKIHQVADVPANEIVGPYTSTTLPVELRINDPETGVRIETLYIPDARFQVPAVQGRVQTKLETTFNFTSDGGTLLAYVGARP
jgi:hypothetical protein